MNWPKMSIDEKIETLKSVLRMATTDLERENLELAINYYEQIKRRTEVQSGSLPNGLQFTEAGDFKQSSKPKKEGPSSNGQVVS